MNASDKATQHVRSAERSARLMVIHQAMAGRELINARKAMGETRGMKAPDDERQAWAKLCARVGISTRTARELMTIANDKAEMVDRLAGASMHHPPAVNGKHSIRLGATKTIRKLLEALELIPMRKKPSRPVRQQGERDRTRDPLALPREVAKRRGYIPVAGPYQDAEADQLAAALRQLTAGGARVALVGSEIWRRKA